MNFAAGSSLVWVTSVLERERENKKLALARSLTVVITLSNDAMSVVYKLLHAIAPKRLMQAQSPQDIDLTGTDTYS